MSNHQTEAPKQCSVCGAPLPADAPFGHCPHCLLALPLTVATPAPPSGKEITELRIFGDYELLGQLGRGGMGVVYRARQRSLNRIVAVKMLLNSALSSPAMVRRFEMEAETVARLDHPHIVPIYEVREDDGQRYFSMKLIEGESLAQQIARKEFTPAPAGRSEDRTRSLLTQERIARLMATIAHAVHYAHGQGVLHRDLKPGNILIDRAGEPHLTDFGLAKADLDGSLTGSGTLLGTPAYMAPEQAAGAPATVATDIYSLGVVLYELLAGRPPFRGTTPVETLRRVVDEEPAHPRTINLHTNRDLGVICMKALEKDPLRRYASAGELAADLERWLRHEPVRARPAGAWLRTSRWTRRNRVGAMLIVVLCIGLSACLILLSIVSEQKRDNQRQLNTLRKSIGLRVADFPNSTRPFEHFSAEEIRILLDKKTAPKGVSDRFTVATLLDLSPMQTLIAGGKIIARIEESMRTTKSRAVHLDFRIYKDYVAMRDDLAHGDVHFASVDGRSCLAAQAIEPAVRALMCDQRPGLRTVIFVPADSAMTNLANLKSRSLVVRDKFLFPISFAFEQLTDAGLCAEDVHCSVLAETGLGKDGQRKPYVKKSPAGYFGSASGIVKAVLVERTFDAGVALESQLGNYREGVQWRRLVTFYTPEFLWVAGPKVDSAAREGFTRALQRFTDPKELEFMLIDTETDGFAFTTATDKFLETFRAAERAQVRFEQCLPPPNGDVPDRPTPNKN